MRIIGLNGEKLSLRNEGELELFFIGVGSAFATKHFQTNFLIIKGDHHIMVDFGMTGPLALTKTAGLGIQDLEVHLPTHSHADHIGGYELLGLNNRYVGIPFMKRPKLKLICTEMYGEILWDRSLRGGMEWNEEERDTRRRLCLTDFFDIIRPVWFAQQPREKWTVYHGPIKIELFRTMHVPDSAPNWHASFFSLGMFIDDRVFVSVDTRYDPDLIADYADRSEVMFHDVQFHKGGVHAELDQLREQPSEVKSKMRLMHYPDSFDQQNISDFAGWTRQGMRYIFNK
jgi:ribonuclease BN (tRNA processing enzyme)